MASAKADKVGKKESIDCKDRLCPRHGDRKLKMRGRTFEGTVVKKLSGRVTIQFERMLKLPKYERYEKRKTKIQARLPDCMKDDCDVGDLILVAETRPISKTIHFVVWKVVRKIKVAEVKV
ncbi:MAG: 30S ribosomal protein S17 [Nanoarchaeota archaeon]|nr:30S ribosomal protein S17 [Nanoarchaeota archaeon]